MGAVKLNEERLDYDRPSGPSLEGYKRERADKYAWRHHHNDMYPIFRDTNLKIGTSVCLALTSL
jgi:hypothetical protein